jgi:hypothetical protein
MRVTSRQLAQSAEVGSVIGLANAPVSVSVGEYEGGALRATFASFHLAEC